MVFKWTSHVMIPIRVHFVSLRGSFLSQLGHKIHETTLKNIVKPSVGDGLDRRYPA